MFVGKSRDVVRVEWVFETAFGNRNRRPRPQRIAHAQLKEGIRVQRREIGDHQIRFEQLLVHWDIDDLGVHDFVGADAGGSGSLDRRLDQNSIRLVEIERLAADRIRLLAKSHHDEAGRLVGHS